MTQDIRDLLKLALEALESSDKLINGSGNHFGLEGAMDGYYSGCFDVDPINKQTEEAITAIKEALAQTQEPVAVYGYCPECGAKGVMRERRPNGNDKCANGHTYPSTPPQRTEQNFCSRCGKRTNDIHTCTPPQENT